MESGWGTSRFYLEANNIFGIWSYNSKEPRISAGETRGEKAIYVRKYRSLEDSIEDYFHMIASGKAYRSFRNSRLENDNPFRLIAHLTHYSELREEYVKRLYDVIKSNQFYQYDTPSYRPIALREIIPEYFVTTEEIAVTQQDEQNSTKFMEASITSETIMQDENNNSHKPEQNSTIEHTAT